MDSVINKKLITAGRLFKFNLSGKARLVKYMSGTDAEVLEYTVAPGSAITKGTLKDISFPKDAVIGGLIRGSESYIAIGSTPHRALRPSGRLRPPAHRQGHRPAVQIDSLSGKKQLGFFSRLQIFYLMLMKVRRMTGR